MVPPALAGLCYGSGAVVARQAREECWRNCEKTCKKRTTQSRALFRQVCEPTPPPKHESSKPPPPPNMTHDPCLPCHQVGGECCGPFTGDPKTGTYTPCACGNPDLGCARYGCK
jgi:hypothetical protein